MDSLSKTAVQFSSVIAPIVIRPNETCHVSIITSKKLLFYPYKLDIIYGYEDMSFSL